LVSLLCIRRWYPAVDTDPDRPGIEGFYLISKLPGQAILSLEIVPLQCLFSPFRLSPDCWTTIRALLQQIRTAYTDLNCPVRLEWEVWESNFIPSTNLDASAYANWGGYRETALFRRPLQRFLKADFIFKSNWNTKLPDKSDNVDSSLDWPELLAAAMPSVKTVFNPHPPESRLFAVIDQRLKNDLQRFKAITLPYYEDLKSSGHGALLTVEKIKNEIWSKKISFNGEYPTTGSLTKAALGKCLESSDEHFLRVMYRNLSSELFMYMFNIVNNPVSSPAELYKTAATIVAGNRTAIVTIQMMHQLRRTSPLRDDLLEAVLLLFESRDRRLIQANHDAHSTSETFKERSRSLFMPPECTRRLLNGDCIDEFIPQDIQQLREVRKMYFVHRQEAESGEALFDKLGLIEVNIEHNCIRYHDPRIDMTVDARDLPEYFSRMLKDIAESFSIFLNRVIDNYLERWPISCYHWRLPNAYDRRLPVYGVLQNDCDAGIYIYAIIYYSEYACPFAFQEEDMTMLRCNLSYWILTGSLPI